MAEVKDPIKIGAYTLKNRLTFAPTVKFDYTDDSAEVTQKHIDHYAERAKGGLGLICVEATAVTPDGRFCRTHLGLWNDAQIEGHKAIAEVCHREGVVTIIQLNHTGLTANPECGEAKGPSDAQVYSRSGRAMSEEELHEMQKAFVSAAVRAKAAGYDGIQLHACHAYLINQFESPLTNFRTDEYGGSPENRARFAAEIIAEIRRLCGPDFLISARISGAESTIEDSVAIGEAYVAAGCDYLQVSNGIAPLDGLGLDDPDYDRITQLGFAFHEHFKGRVPVSCVSMLRTPEEVKRIISEDRCDTVDLARAVLADPEFGLAVLGEKEDYVRCFDCKRCQYGPFTQHVCPAELKRKAW